MNLEKEWTPHEKRAHQRQKRNNVRVRAIAMLKDDESVRLSTAVLNVGDVQAGGLAINLSACQVSTLAWI
jgi:hypothetical protein